MKMIVTYLAGFISAFILVMTYIQGDLIPGLFIAIPVTIFSFIFVHKVHKRKQKEYYDRWKND